MFLKNKNIIFKIRSKVTDYAALSLCKACDPQGRANLGSMDIIPTNLVDQQIMLHTKYHGSRPCGFR